MQENSLLIKCLFDLIFDGTLWQLDKMMDWKQHEWKVAQTRHVKSPSYVIFTFQRYNHNSIRCMPVLTYHSNSNSDTDSDIYL